MKLTKTRARKVAKNKRRTKRQMMKSGGKLSLSFRLDDCFLGSASNNRAYLNTLKEMIQERNISTERINDLLKNSGYTLVNDEGNLVFMYNGKRGDGKSGDTIDCNAIKKIADIWDKFSLGYQQQYSLLEYRKGTLTRKSRSLGWLANMLDPPPSYAVSASVTPPSGAGLPSYPVEKKKLNFAFLDAASDGRVGDMLRFLERGADVNHTNHVGMTALLFAVNQGHTKVVKLLLESSAETEHKYKDGMTALLYAASKGNKEIVKLLLENGANIEHANNYGETALLYAATIGYKDVVKLLLENDANIEHANNDGETALLNAARYHHKDIVQLLVDRGANIEHASNDGDTARLLATTTNNDHE